LSPSTEEDNLLLETPNNAPHPIVAMTTTNPTASIETASLLTDAALVVIPTHPIQGQLHPY